MSDKPEVTNNERNGILGMFGLAEDRVIEALDLLRSLNKEGSPARSRELSIGITYLEDGMLRVNEAHRRCAGLEP